MIRIAGALSTGYLFSMNPIPDPKLARARELLEGADWNLSELAAAVGWSPSHLQRRFREEFGLSPAEYLAQRRLDTFKRELREQSDVTRALYEAGYGSPSRIYEDGAARLGMAPGAYKRGGAGLQIRWTVLATAIGPALIAATERGLCAIALGDDEAKLQEELRGEFPQAELLRVDAGRDEFLAPRVQAVAALFEGKQAQLPVELIGTAFQRRVWEALMKIPRGETRSYAQLATSVGRPRATRAVARACAQNRLAVVVPCHRIVRGDGSPGGYRWGVPRKEDLLRRERAR